MRMLQASASVGQSISHILERLAHARKFVLGLGEQRGGALKLFVAAPLL
jgi:hypothetical protein